MKCLALTLSLLLVLGSHLQAGEPETTPLARRLAAYDQRGGGNTIPIEKEILALNRAHDVEGLLPYVNHDRFGETVAWAACMAADAKSAEHVVQALMGWSDEKKAHIAPDVARMPGDASEVFLISIAIDAMTPMPLRRRIRAANALRRHPRTLETLRSDLASEQPGIVQEALLTLADAQAPSFLAQVAPLLDDERALPEPEFSHFKVEKREEVSPGRVRVTKTAPRLETVGALALEVANRLVQPTTPDYIAWWYEWERLPRFGFGAEGRARFARWMEAIRGGGGGDAAPLSDAVEAALTWIRTQHDERPRGGVVVESWERDGDHWVLRLGVAEDTVVVQVDDALKVQAA